MVFEGFYGIYGVLLPVWMGAVGWNLYRLGRSSEQVPVVQPALSPLEADTAEKKVQVVLITGLSDGHGRAVAERLTASGHTR